MLYAFIYGVVIVNTLFKCSGLCNGPGDEVTSYPKYTAAVAEYLPSVAVQEKLLLAALHVCSVEAVVPHRVVALRRCYTFRHASNV